MLQKYKDLSSIKQKLAVYCQQNLWTKSKKTVNAEANYSQLNDLLLRKKRTQKGMEVFIDLNKHPYFTTCSVEYSRFKKCHYTFSGRMTILGSWYFPREVLSNTFTLEYYKFNICMVVFYKHLKQTHMFQHRRGKNNRKSKTINVGQKRRKETEPEKIGNKI